MGAISRRNTTTLHYTIATDGKFIRNMNEEEDEEDEEEEKVVTNWRTISAGSEALLQRFLTHVRKFETRKQMNGQC